MVARSMGGWGAGGFPNRRREAWHPDQEEENDSLSAPGRNGASSSGVNAPSAISCSASSLTAIFVLSSPGPSASRERPASRCRCKRQRKPVRQNLLTVEDEKQIHRCTSCGFPSDRALEVSTLDLPFERKQRLLDLVETGGPVVLRHAFVGCLVGQVFDPGPVHQDRALGFEREPQVKDHVHGRGPTFRAGRIVAGCRCVEGAPVAFLKRHEPEPF
ncbi:hypothetical protein NGR_b00980 (plasmid) [Sinorhizobium fredii NGR234]|uniref:Uncharacterized protein n=1 Tax=Sinorhizobium fredii (strain NBRC 101917 / NGR234) TaxID=394 RepID=C3KMZ4_SINFN|nr:hypothetical protein NGR_b00980 [Sinorhizobium fredii NGR234]